MAYNYYQSQYPGWGTSQFQFGAPPMPIFQPNPSWGGYDYYNASAINPDRSLYYSIISRMREFGLTGGVGLHDARKWHRRVYSGLVNLGQVLPSDIGSAAAYEAYRNWRHHHSLLFNPLGGRVEREREGLIGLAVAEASHLWQYSGRPYDTYGMRDALESAALTASRISARVMEDDRDRYLGRAGSVGSYYSGSGSDFDSPDLYPSEGRRRLRRHSYSHQKPPIILGTAPSIQQASPYAAGMPIPGAVSSISSGYMPGYAGSYGGGSPYQGSVGSVYPSANLGVAGYPGSYPGVQPGLQAGYPGSYPGPGMVMPGSISNPYLPGTAVSAGSVYPTLAPTYTGSQYLSPNGYLAPGGSTVYPGQAGGATIIIPPRSRKSSRHHHHRHSSR